MIQPFVDDFLKELRSQGMTTAPIFYDHLQKERRPYSGRALRRTLVEAIHCSACMVSFVSPGYLSSSWCVFEWAFMDGASLHRGPSFSAILPLSGRSRSSTRQELNGYSTSCKKRTRSQWCEQKQLGQRY